MGLGEKRRLGSTRFLVGRDGRGVAGAVQLALDVLPIEALRIAQLPVPQIAAHRLERLRGGELEFLLRECRVSDEVGYIALPGKYRIVNIAC